MPLLVARRTLVALRSRPTIVPRCVLLHRRVAPLGGTITELVAPAPAATLKATASFIAVPG